MKNYFSSNFKLGILGGGQLGKMLLLETQKLDIQSCVLDPSEDAPCKNSCNNFFVGDLNNFEDVYNFGKNVDVLTIEIEHVNIDAMKQLEKEGVKIFPSPVVLETIKNKARQKDFYKSNNIPTSKYFKYTNLLELKNDIENSKLKLPFVWKSCEMGYDGKGVEIIRKEEDIYKISEKEEIILIEECVDIEKELAVIVARNQDGDIKTYPLVEMLFNTEANLVEFVISPVKIDENIEKKTRELAKKIAEKFNTSGLLAVEFFITKKGEVLVNEIAPRVHNSGHHTLNGSFTSQFEQHLRAILNLPLGETESTMYSVMVNLVGEKDHVGPVCYRNMEKILNKKGVYPILYGKKETRPFRKMGHINVVSKNSLEEALNLAREVKKEIKVISMDSKNAL